MKVSTDGSDLGVDGSHLWELSAFGSSNPDGSGPKYLEKRQVLTPAQGDTPLNPGEPLDFGDVNFNLDMADNGCGEVQYVCVSLRKNPRASVDFVIEPVPDESALTSCQPVKCDGEYSRINDFGCFGKSSRLIQRDANTTALSA